jgi:hypothetical protein
MSRRREFQAGEAPPQQHGVQQRVRHMLEIERLCNRFHLIAQQLQTRQGGRETLRVNDEHDLWDFLRALLALEHDDVRPITWTPAYAGSVRTDFLLKIERTVLVAKLVDAAFDASQLSVQLQADVEHYRRRPDCATLVCFIYDPEQRIAGARALEHDLSDDQQQPAVRVIVAPKQI